MTLAGEKLQAIAGCLDLKAALEDLPRNDLLPPRVEDKVAGQLRQGFLESLGAALADGSYRPLPADRVLVPKPRFASRPAALLGLEDRVLYSALVALIGDKLDRALDEPDRVFWPRGQPSRGRWSDFERAPLKIGPSHVVLADVAGFYESVDHVRLRRILIYVVGNTPAVDALVSWLTEVMDAARGLPQGYGPSDHLASVYLSAADAAVARAGFLLHRHGDDIRIPVHDYPDALRAAHAVEQGLRLCQLLPNSSKLSVETVAKYKEDLDQTDRDARELRAQLRLDAAKRLLAEGDSEDSYYLLQRLGIEREPAGGYRDGPVAGPEEVAELEALLMPNTAEHAWAMLDDGMRRRPGSGNPGPLLSNEHFHERVAGALPVLSGAKDARALVHCPLLLARHGEKTPLVASYLSAMAGERPEDVGQVCSQTLSLKTFMLGWQRAWLWNTLAKVSPLVIAENTLGLARQAAISDGNEWIERLEATKLLAAGGKLERQILLTIWERAPAVYHADLIAAASMLVSSQDWAERFLATARLDLVHMVVRTNVKGSKRT